MRRGRKAAALKGLAGRKAGSGLERRPFAFGAVVKGLTPRRWLSWWQLACMGGVAVLALVSVDAAYAQDWLEQIESRTRNNKEMTEGVEGRNFGSPEVALFFKECMFRDVEGACSELIRRNDPESKISNWTRGSAYRKRGEMREVRKDRCGAISDYQGALDHYAFPSLSEKILTLRAETAGACGGAVSQGLARVSTQDGIVALAPEAEDESAGLASAWTTTINVPTASSVPVAPAAAKSAALDPVARVALTHTTDAEGSPPVQPPSTGVSLDFPEAARRAEPVATAPQPEKIVVAAEAPPPTEAAPEEIPRPTAFSRELETSALPVAPVTVVGPAMPQDCASQRASASLPGANADCPSQGLETLGTLSTVAFRPKTKEAVFNRSFRRSMLAVMALLAGALGLAVFVNRKYPDWPARISEVMARGRGAGPYDASPPVLRRQLAMPLAEDLPESVTSFNDRLMDAFDDEFAEAARPLDDVSDFESFAANPEIDTEPFVDVPDRDPILEPAPAPAEAAPELAKPTEPVRPAKAAPALLPEPIAPRRTGLREFTTGSRVLSLIAEGSIESVDQGSTTLLVIDGEGSLSRNVRLRGRETRGSDAPERLLLVEPSAANCAGLFNIFDIAITGGDRLSNNGRFNAVFERESIVYEALFGASFTQNNRLALRHFSRLLHAIPGANLRSWHEMLTPYSLAQLGDYAMLTNHPETIRYFNGTATDAAFQAFGAELHGRLSKLLTGADFTRLTCGPSTGPSLEHHVREGWLIIFSNELAKLGSDCCAALMRIFIVHLIDCLQPPIGAEAKELPQICLLLDQPDRLFGPQKAEYQFLMGELSASAIQVIRA